MGYAKKCIDGGNYFLVDFFVAEAITAGQALVIEATATNVGEVADPAAVTGAADFAGCAMDAATFNATPTAEPSQVTQENLVRVAVNPHILWSFPVSGGATAGTVLQPSTATPAHILVNDTLDATPDLITDTAVGTVNMAGGLVKGKLGANVGALRKLNAHTNSVSTSVGVDFLFALAVGDQFIRVPYSRHVVAMQFTTDFTQANGIIATGTGAPFAVVNVVIDEVLDKAWIEVVARDHYLSPEAV